MSGRRWRCGMSSRVKSRNWPRSFQVSWGNLAFCRPPRRARVAEFRRIIHTPSMTLKNAALLALIGTLLVTALLTWDLIFNVLNVVQGLIPAVVLFRSLLYTFGAFSAAAFFFVFHKAQR